MADLDKLNSNLEFLKKMGLANEGTSAIARALESMKAQQFHTTGLGMNVPKPPVFDPVKLPSPSEANKFQSAGVLLRRLADSITKWRAELPQDGTVQPAVLALLQGNIQIEVETLAEESFHGIRIEGKIDNAPCIVLAHQATVQLLCLIQPVQPPERPQRPIGFVIDGEAFQA